MSNAIAGIEKAEMTEMHLLKKEALNNRRVIAMPSRVVAMPSKRRGNVNEGQWKTNSLVLRSFGTFIKEPSYFIPLVFTTFLRGKSPQFKAFFEL